MQYWATNCTILNHNQRRRNIWFACKYSVRELRQNWESLNGFFLTELSLSIRIINTCSCTSRRSPPGSFWAGKWHWAILCQPRLLDNKQMCRLAHANMFCLCCGPYLTDVHSCPREHCAASGNLQMCPWEVVWPSTLSHSHSPACFSYRSRMHHKLKWYGALPCPHTSTYTAGGINLPSSFSQE